MDITRQIHDAENSLRDFIHQVFSQRHGDDWIEQLPIAQEMANRWESARMPDEVSSKSLKGFEKLIQYATISDLRTILAAHWCDEFTDTFGDRGILDVYLKILSDYRDPDSRRRELFVHQKHLLLGISGDIRNRIVTWRSQQEVGGIYSRIEIVRDNIGNNWTPGDPRRVRTENKLIVGDTLEFIITASDPEESEIKYRCHHGKWQANNIVVLKVDNTMVGKQSLFHLMVKSNRKHHAYPMGFDDRVSFDYEVVPA